MDENEQKQQLNFAYLQAVASAAGFACQPHEVDNDSVDRTILARGWVHQRAVLRSPRIDVQLKSLTHDPLEAAEESFVFRLPKKNYDDLRQRLMVPRLLVVWLLPHDPGPWLEQDHQRMLSRYAAYYVSLCGLPQAPQRHQVPIELPRKNLFSVAKLRRLMAQASRGMRKLR
jgi:hypothetical protein